MLQAINKLNDYCRFTKSDEILIGNLASHVGITLRNAQYYEDANQFKNQVKCTYYSIFL